MKKLITVLLALLLLTLPTVALAAGEAAAAESPQFFSWAMLATYAGAVLATTLLVQLTKGVGFLDRIPTRIYSYFIALVLLIAAAYFTGNLTWSQAALCLVNAAVVSLASNGAYDAVAHKKRE